MKRDPKQTYIENHMKSISVNKIFPFLFYCKCEKCGMEYIREPMYECSSKDWLLGKYHYVRGCTNCFSNKKVFTEWLQDNDYLYTEEYLSKKWDSPIELN